MLWILSMLFLMPLNAEAARIKDITSLYGDRQNAIVGYGLVTGLRRTGDSMRNAATIQTLSKRLMGMGITLTTEQIRARNVAVVMVTARIASSARPGQLVDVEVSSTGDAISLEGGVLLMTPLMAPNGDIYAVAQGPIVTGSFTASQNGSSSRNNYPNVGRIPQGATVEKENPGRLDLMTKEQLDFLLNDPDYTTAKRMVDAINAQLGQRFAIAVDSGAVTVKIPDEYKTDVVSFLALLEGIDVAVDIPAKVVVNERTGTVVMGSDVRISQVAVAHGGLTIEINTQQNPSQPSVLSTGTTVVTENSQVSATEEDGKLMLVGGVTIGDLVTALNALGVKPRDLIQILIAIQASGAMQAELEVL
ncbi:MAG: flagellar basal body P-ring protein FlgI [Myxococcota bacterium]|nr:flagellar basal body P-ring protein FlgI [Myxococcota bacterium]